MFTGLVESMGTIARAEDTGAGRRLTARDAIGPQLSLALVIGQPLPVLLRLAGLFPERSR